MICRRNEITNTILENSKKCYTLLWAKYIASCILIRSHHKGNWNLTCLPSKFCRDMKFTQKSSIQFIGYTICRSVTNLDKPTWKYKNSSIRYNFLLVIFVIFRQIYPIYKLGIPNSNFNIWQKNLYMLVAFFHLFLNFSPTCIYN